MTGMIELEYMVDSIYEDIEKNENECSEKISSLTFFYKRYSQVSHAIYKYGKQSTSTVKALPTGLYNCESLFLHFFFAIGI